jgi:hypothetical protein
VNDPPAAVALVVNWTMRNSNNNWQEIYIADFLALREHEIEPHQMILERKRMKKERLYRKFRRE